MTRPDRHFLWHQVLAPSGPAPSVIDSRHRLRWLLAAFVLAVTTVLARAAWLEVQWGQVVRVKAAKPLARETALRARRGRILTRDGTVLAVDRTAQILAVHYRWLEAPPNPSWLRQSARSRLSGAARRDPEQLQAEESRLRVERVELHRRLARLCGISTEGWNEARARVQARVERIAQHVNARRQERFALQQAPSASPMAQQEQHDWYDRLANLWREPQISPPAWIVVREQLAYHPLSTELSDEAAGEILAHPELYPGVRISERLERSYPRGTLAAHLVGHLGVVGEAELASPRSIDSTTDAYREGDFVGRAGLERQYERLLRGRQGTERQTTDRRGEMLTAQITQAPTTGRDLLLTIDSTLQASAERLLDSALARRLGRETGSSASGGGAIVVLDCRDGAILASASAPRFNPNVMLSGEVKAIEQLLSAPDHPLLDRVSQMAIPPGSVMKTITALALLEENLITSGQPFFCQGYLKHPDELRCALFRQQGIGHGEIRLDRALAESCNVYFFHHAARLGPQSLVRWARECGLGAPTGVEVPGEVPGNVPNPVSTSGTTARNWQTGDTQALSIGQSTLTVTPLQMARVMAAIANGGQLVTPHLVRESGKELLNSAAASQHRLPVQGKTLEAIRRGLERAVNDPAGTAADVRMNSVTCGAKTGTAQTGDGQLEHAWVVGYAPAEHPQLVFAVALEHAGDANHSACPVANRLLARLDELGYFSQRQQPQ